MSFTSKGDWTWYAVSQRIVKWIMKFSVFVKVISAFLRTSKCRNSFVFFLMREVTESTEK